MATTTTTKEVKKMRHEIRMIDVPDKLFKAIEKNAKKNLRSNGDEVIVFLENKKYK